MSKLKKFFHICMQTCVAGMMGFIAWIFYQIMWYDQIILAEPNKTIIMFEALLMTGFSLYLIVIAGLSYWRLLKG